MRLSVVKLLNSATLNQTLGKLKSDAPAYWQSVKTTNKEALYKRITNINNWYTKVIGLDEVRTYQDRVVSLQERLLEAQEKRREIGRNLAEIRKKSNQLQDEIHKVKRSEDIERFLNLMKEETEVLKLEHDITRTFQECDQAERELFTAFTNAVRDSHEKQRAQLEYTKYFGIILSIAGSFLAFCYTTLRKDDLKRFMEDSLTTHLAENRVVVSTSSSAGNDDTAINNKSLMDFVKNESIRLGEMIKHTQNDVAQLVDLEKEAKTKQLMYYVGATALILVVLRVISN